MTLNALPEHQAGTPAILVLEQNEAQRQAIAQWLNTLGFRGHVVSTLQEALEFLAINPIHIVLAEVSSFSPKGLAACHMLRSQNPNQYLYIIVVSTTADDDFLVQAIDAGADDVLRMPIDSNELEARLHSALRRIQLQTTLQQRTQALAQVHNVIAQDLTTVSVLQRSYLPTNQQPFSDLSLAWLSVPSVYVSGDHLQVFPLAENSYGFYVLDVSGHGVSAAVKSIQLVHMLADLSPTSVLLNAEGLQDKTPAIAKPSVVMARLNQMFQQTDADLSYFTMIYGTFNTATGAVCMCQAGHPSPILCNARGQVTALGQGGYPVGLFEMDEYEDIELTLGPDEALFLYSDGVTEVMSPEQTMFGEARLLEWLQTHTEHGLSNTLPAQLEAAIRQWGGKSVRHGFQDDVSILMLGRRGAWASSQPVADNTPVLENQLAPVLSSMPRSGMKSGRPEWSQAVPRSVLIVDDSRTFLRIFEAMLSSWGYDVYAASDGQEALQKIHDIKPDFLLTDWDMPGMSGIELCQEVRGGDHPRYTYIIMITGFASREELLRSLHVGADDFLTKPVNPNELRARLKTAERMAKVHFDLAAHHQELATLTDDLQRDMREVSRIQRALLPKPRLDPWPCAIQTLYRPLNDVCGKQFGIMETQTNEYGFFMISMPGHSTSTALQTMALGRWFGMARATQLLFPIEEASSKKRRYLADPKLVKESLSSLPSRLGQNVPQFDLLYGLLNTDHGTLLMAGLGAWSVVIAQPGEPLFFHQQHWTGGCIIYQDIVLPGSRIYFYPGDCGPGFGLQSKADWESRVFRPTLGASGSLLLAEEFGRLTAHDPSQIHNRVDMMLAGVQWREQFEVHTYTLEQATLREWVNGLRALGQSLEDTVGAHTQALDLGEYKNILAFQSICDTVAIAHVAREARLFAERHGLDEHRSYELDLVLSEALSNVMIHAYRGMCPDPIVVAVLAFEQGLGIVLHDQGASIPEVVLQRVRNDTQFVDDLPLDQLPEGGMGLKFMRMVSRRFAYHPKKNQEASNALLLLV